MDEKEKRLLQVQIDQSKLQDAKDKSESEKLEAQILLDQIKQEKFELIQEKAKLSEEKQELTYKFLDLESRLRNTMRSLEDKEKEYQL